jgi:hypothetical protein
MSKLLDVLFGCRTHNPYTFPMSVKPGQRRSETAGGTAQVLLNTNLLRLQKAVLCVNCEVVS